MNLKELLGFNTLSEAQSHSTVSKKMISPDAMLAYLTAFDLLDIIENPTTKESKGLSKAFQFGSEFNLMVGHPLDQSSMLTQMVSDNLVPESFKTYVIAQANKVVFPYKNVTQEQWDEAQLMFSPAKVETTYSGGEFIPRIRNEKICVEVTIDEPLPYDDTFEFTVQSKNIGDVFAESFDVRGRLTIPADFVGSVLSAPLNLTGTKRHVKVFAQSKYNRNFAVFSEITE